MVFQTSDRDWPAQGRLGRRTSTCLKITFVGGGGGVRNTVLDKCIQVQIFFNQQELKLISM